MRSWSRNEPKPRHPRTRANELDPDAVPAIPRALLEKSRPGIVGHFRREQIWIGGGSSSPHNASFIPPHHDRVPELMADVMRFAQRTDLSVIAQGAIAHAQFETIHPFPNGSSCCLKSSERALD